MENRFPVFEGADVAEDFLQLRHHFVGILSGPGHVMGIGADGDDPATQLVKPLEIIQSRQGTAAAVDAGGVQLHALAPLHQLPQDLVEDGFVVAIAQKLLPGVGPAFGDIGQVTQNIVVIMVPDALQRLFQKQRNCLLRMIGKGMAVDMQELYAWSRSLAE